MGNRLHKESDTTGDGFKDHMVDYIYDRNDRLIEEKAYSDRGATLDTTVYRYGPDGGTDPAGDYTVLTRKKVFNGEESEVNLYRALQVDYDYNLQGRLEKADVKVYNYWGGVIDEQTLTEYTYNDQGIRVQQTEQVDGGPIEITHYVIDANNPTGYAQVLEEWVDTDGPGGDDPTLEKSCTLGHDVIAQADDAGIVYYFLYDGHGSTRSLADDTGNVVAAADDAGGDPVNHLIYDAYRNALDFSQILSHERAGQVP